MKFKSRRVRIGSWHIREHISGAKDLRLDADIVGMVRIVDVCNFCLHLFSHTTDIGHCPTRRVLPVLNRASINMLFGSSYSSPGVGRFFTVQTWVYDQTHLTDMQGRTSYPPDTNASLYYTAPSERPRISGEVRLRITSSDDPASFASGADLLRLNIKWSRPLLAISKPLYAKLRQDWLVSGDLDSILSTLPGKRFLYSRGQILYTSNDGFIIDFSYCTCFNSLHRTRHGDTRFPWPIRWSACFARR